MSLNQKISADILVLKDPGLALYLDEIESLFPPYKLIVLVRDPRDVIASMKNVSIKKEESFDIKKTADEIFIYYFKIGKYHKISKKTVYSFVMKIW